MEICISTHETKLNTEEFISSLMKRRVKQGYPEKFTIIVNERFQTAYNWTDGIDSILSIFIPLNLEIIQEISIIGSINEKNNPAT